MSHEAGCFVNRAVIFFYETLTVLFTKLLASRFPALPGTIPPFHCSICEAFNGGTASGGHSCRQYF